MAAPKTKTRTEREEHLSKVADFYCKGWRQCNIAQELGVDPSQISYDLRILRGRWERASTHKIDRYKAQELAKIDHLEREYWDAWKRSKQAGLKISKKREVNGRMVTDTQQAENPPGNPRFLDGVQWCIERRCKILGIDAPATHELRGNKEHPVEVNVNIIDARAKLAQLIDRIAATGAETDDPEPTD